MYTLNRTRVGVGIDLKNYQTSAEFHTEFHF